MLKNLSIVALWFLIPLLVKVSGQEEVPLFVNTAALVNNQLYVLNGTDEEIRFSYLDVSVPFNTKALEWKPLSRGNVFINHGAKFFKGGSRNDTLFLFGRYGWSRNKRFHTFNTRRHSWKSQKTSGDDDVDIKPEKVHFTGVVDHDGKMYINDGDMLMFDTINLSWSRRNAPPSGLFLYGATLLPNRKILYFGHQDKIHDDYLTLNKVYLYDTVKDRWGMKTVSGTIPTARANFSSVLGPDGKRVIIFGGDINNGGAFDYYPQDVVYVLSLTNWNWYVPSFKGRVPITRSFHDATVIGKYMVITFGVGYYNTEDILLLDVSNNGEYVWTTNFVPTQPIGPKPTTSKKNRPIVIGAVIGFLIGGIFLLRNKRAKAKLAPDQGRGATGNKRVQEK